MFLHNKAESDDLDVTLVRAADSAIEIEQFLSASGSSLVYYCDSYLNFLSDILPDAKVYYAVAKKEECLVGVMPFAVCKHPSYGAVVNALPFFGSHGGPIVSDGESQDKIVPSMISLIERSISDISSFTIVENIFFSLNEGVLNKCGFTVVDDRIGQCSLLPDDSPNLENTLMGMLHMKTRNAVRKGLSFGQSIERRIDTDSLHWLQSVHEKSIKSIGGKYKSFSVFEKLIENFSLEEKSALYVGTLDGEDVSGVLVLTYKDTIEYFTPVVVDEYKDKQLLSALIFQVMIESVKNGYKKWNWGGTWRSQEGVYRFKKRWGAEDFPYRYFSKVYNSDFSLYGTENLVSAFPYFYLYKY